MKKITLLLLMSLSATLGHAQTTEVSVHLTSGASLFRGQSASEEAAIFIPDNEAEPPYKYLYTLLDVPYTGNPFGKKPGLAYGAAAQVQHVTARHLVFGVQGGYEVLQSRTPIFVVFDKHDFGLSAQGTATLANSFITVHPFAGYRLTRHKLDYDLTLGPEIGLLQRSHETAEATLASPHEATYTTDLDRQQRKVDVRVRLNLTAYYQRLGFSVGYSRGLSNYRSDYSDSFNQLYSQVFRTGISYRLGV
ncbi:hypothetical protein LGH70_11885 [Hymenobacter sp. BT635]|uniref:Outer membrane protein beta-barrel domain-containing protein n=1 Tax=Hymenobacter nitidus TaxID=2880929 RepID=A0ABS8AFR1_9BACT|nr:hypothetical protein [Hymenobacter nitidus]MCB2378289.1 hypothetical protein [Hymenobacter nitidus]